MVIVKPEGSTTPVSALQQKVRVGKDRGPSKKSETLLERAASVAEAPEQEPWFSIKIVGERKKCLVMKADLPTLPTDAAYVRAHGFFYGTRPGGLWLSVAASCLLEFATHGQHR